MSSRVTSGGGSLHRRLLSAAALWIALALFAVGLLLVALFRHHAGQELAARAAQPLDALAAALEVQRTADGGAALRLSGEPADDAFRRPYGGAYWWVADGSASPLRSRSWWDTQPPASLNQSLARPTDPGIGRHDALGPQRQPLAVWARRAELGGWERPLVVAVALDASRLESMTRDFARTVALALGALAVSLWAACWLQVRLGLAPLARLQQALAGLRAGHARTLEGRFPIEVQPLVDDLNAMLADNDRLVSQAREHGGNLAHALKTPLAVLRNAAAGWSGDEGAGLRGQLLQIERQVELHLARARATATTRAAGRSGDRRSDAPAVVDALLRTLQRLHADRGIEVERSGAASPPAVAIEAEVLHELLGNLLDNAFRWARRRVSVAIVADDAQRCLRLNIDDDGPGIAPQRRAEALQRGRRLDETQPGSGLGLAIADQLVRLSAGALVLDDAPLGGLRVSLTLPVAVPPR
ncbi:MAG TPA: HAMP domain-containing sensor histidine kinase [Methylibium sp.]|uniref:sensor histidine kinase n=1 Tax=Methylibium sp. TaxID=2067992 RepID=UPI002DBA22B3|nr:HAMP domain-containing sensor histidine kinase [Methylibium sp.]HEU4458564.1 HAMP domain-containing sensor histidine kinase [Methylibium sp.]